MNMIGRGMLLVLLAALSLNARAEISPLIGQVLAQLHLKEGQCNESLIVEKKLPNANEVSVVVIPKIADSGDEFFTLDSYILLVNNTTGKIISQYFESSKTNGWSSDAVRLSKIVIDTAPYTLAEGKRAFGIRVVFEGESRPNPYSSTIVSLFLQNGGQLQRVLSNYELKSYHGEWDTNCAGAFKEEEKTIKLSGEATNGYKDLIIINKVTETTNHLVRGDCKTNEKVRTVHLVLRFNKGSYR